MPISAVLLATDFLGSGFLEQRIRSYARNLVDRFLPRIWSSPNWQHQPWPASGFRLKCWNFQLGSSYKKLMPNARVARQATKMERKFTESCNYSVVALKKRLLSLRLCDFFVFTRLLLQRLLLQRLLCRFSSSSATSLRDFFAALRRESSSQFFFVTLRESSWHFDSPQESEEDCRTTADNL